MLKKLVMEKAIFLLLLLFPLWLQHQLAQKYRVQGLEEGQYEYSFNSSKIVGRGRRSPPTTLPLPPWEGQHWRILINEVNTDSANPSSSLFIELRLVYTKGRHGPSKRNKLEDFFLVIIKAHEPQIVFLLDLKDFDFTVNNNALFLVIGEEGVPRLGIPLNHEKVMSIYKDSPKDRLLPNGNDSPFGILLLYAKSKRKLANELKLNQNTVTKVYSPKKINSYLLENIKTLLVDMVVYGKKTHVSTCNIFDYLWPPQYQPETTKAYILRDWDVGVQLDYSLNRCGVGDEPFQPSGFKYGKPSPGDLNDCTGPSFFVENVIDDLAPLLTASTVPVPGCGQSQANVPSGRLAMIDPNALAEYRAERYPDGSDESVIPDPQSSTADIASNIVRANAKIKDLGGTAVESKIIESTPFNPDWINTAKGYLPNNAAILSQSLYQQWLRVVIPGSNSRPVTFHCDACLTYFKVAKVDVRTKKAIMTIDGYYNSDPQQNMKTIIEHTNHPIYLSAVKYSMKLAEAKTEEEIHRLNAEILEKVSESLRPTVAMIRTILTEVKAEVPFIYHDQFVKLQQENGVDLGHMFASATGAKKIVDSISDSMHKILLKHLVSEDKPFALICDASTTTRNIPILNTYIQTIEDGYPINYYYRFIELEDGEAALATYNSFMSSVNKDDEIAPEFKAYIKNRMVFFVSDNAAVMIGSQNSFWTLLTAELGRPLPNIGCLAHKTSLVLKAAIRDSRDADLAFIMVFERQLNDLYIFYNSRGSKRFQHFRDTAEEYNIVPLRFKKNIVVRWAAGEANVINTIIKNRVIAEDDLKKISTDKVKFPQPTVRENAAKLLKTITDTTTVLLYYEFADFLNINMLLSLTFQERSGIMLDHANIFLKAIEDYNGLKSKPGPNVQKFLDSCNCENVCQPPQCTMEMLESCNTDITCGASTLGNNIPKDFKLHLHREKIYTKLIDALSKYFDVDFMESLLIFDNRRYFENPTLADDNHKIQFLKVCNFFRHNDVWCEDLRQEFLSLFKTLCETTTYSKNFMATPSKFWPLVLMNGDNLLTISKKLAFFFEKLLVMSDSSAESERGFSVMTRILHGARSSLQSDMLDKILRIRINGAKDLNEMKIVQYAEEFIENRAAVDDPEQEFRTRSMPKKSGSGTRVSRLF